MRRWMIGGLCLLFMWSATGCKGYTSRQAEYRKAGIEQLEAGNYQSAIQFLDQALDEKKGRAGAFQLDVLKYRGEAEYKAEDYEAAMGTYEALLNVSKGNLAYLEPYVQSCLLAGRADKALYAYRQIDLENSKKQSAIRVLAALAGQAEEGVLSEEMHQEVDGLVEEGIARWSGTGLEEMGDLYSLQGIHFMNAGDYDQALSCFESGILDLGGGDGNVKMAARSCYFNQAVAYEHKGEFSRALELFEAYEANFGASAQTSREITFLRTR